MRNSKFVRILNGQSYFTIATASKAIKLFMEGQIKNLTSSKPTANSVDIIPTTGPLAQIPSYTKKELLLDIGDSTRKTFKIPDNELIN